MKNAQEDSDGIANQSLPLTQSQSDQNIDCSASNVQTVSQEPNNAQATSEVSSSHDQPVSTTSGGVSSTANYSDSDEADDCPVFEYSAESMQVAKESKESPDSTPNKVEQSVDDNMENDEDLVQLDDDEHFGNVTGISDEHANQTQTEAEQTIESPVASPETTTNTGTESPEHTPLNNESNECESNEATASKPKATDNISDSEDQIAETSEAQPKVDVQKGNNDKNENANVGIEGMDTEMISEDEHELHDDQVTKESKADKENNNQKSDRDDSFKKVSKSNKDRNYRDKKDKNVNKGRSRRSRSMSSFSRSRSRSPRLRSRTRSRSRSRNRNRRGDRRPRRKDNREKRQEMQRYDVRTLIAERQPRSIKDKYGRDTSRPARSVTPKRRRSRSFSRSISPGLYFGNFSWNPDSVNTIIGFVSVYRFSIITQTLIV